MFKKLFAPLIFVLFMILKFGKILLSLLKFGKFGSLLTMLISVWVYSYSFGWPFAIGFVLLIFIHECGHAFVLKKEGIPCGLPVFIPFVGALISMKGLPRDAWVEAKVGIGGPLFGSLAAGLLLLFNLCLQEPIPLLFALAQTGFLLNLFNMLPVTPMDGGRIVGAVSQWFLVVGLGFGVAFYFSSGYHSLLLVMLILGAFKVWDSFKRPLPGYYSIPLNQRLTMGACYLLLLGFLFWGHSYSSSFFKEFYVSKELALYTGAFLYALAERVKDWGISRDPERVCFFFKFSK